jgi:hypothetical protein
MGTRQRMTFVQIKVENIDENASSIFYRSRTTTFKIGSQNLKTPLRPITRGEFNAKKNLPISIPMFDKDNILFLYYKLSFNDMQSFLFDNKKYQNIYNDARGILKRGKYALLPVLLVQPSSEGLNALSNEGLCNKFLRMSIQMQIDLGMPLLTIPHLGKFERCEFLQKILKQTQENNQEVIFFIDLNHEPKHLTKIVDLIGEENTAGAMNLVGFKYHPYKSVSANFDYVWEKLNHKNIGIILADVKRYDENDYLSLIHYSEFRLGDLYCIENPKGYGTPTKLSLKLFDREELTVKSLVKFLPPKDRLIEELELNPDTKDYNYIDFLFDGLDKASNQEQLMRLSYFSKVHELTASTKEIEVSKKFIDQHDSKTYIEEKKPLSSRLSSESFKRASHLNSFIKNEN